VSGNPRDLYPDGPHRDEFHEEYAFGYMVPRIGRVLVQIRDRMPEAVAGTIESTLPVSDDEFRDALGEQLLAPARRREAEFKEGVNAFCDRLRDRPRSLRVWTDYKELVERMVEMLEPDQWSLMQATGRSPPGALTWRMDARAALARDDVAKENADG